MAEKGEIAYDAWAEGRCTAMRIRDDWQRDDNPHEEGTIQLRSWADGFR